MNRTDIFEKIREMIADARDLPSESIQPETSLMSLGLESLDFVELMVLAQSQCGVKLTAEYFINHPDLTLDELCRHILDEAAQ